MAAPAEARVLGGLLGLDASARQLRVRLVAVGRSVR